MQIGLSALGGFLGLAGVVCASLAVFLNGPPLLTRGARALGVGGLLVGAAGFVQELAANGFAWDPSKQGGRGSLLASGGMLLLIFGAARAAERRRMRRVRERLATERKSVAASRTPGARRGSVDESCIER